MSSCDTGMHHLLLSNWIIMNMIFMKGTWNLHYFKKETLSQGFPCKFCEFVRKRLLLRLFANYSANFWRTTSRFFMIEPAFCERDKIINLTILKLTRISFLIKLHFILSDYCIAWKLSTSLCIQPECRKMQTLFKQCCAVRDAN